MQCGPHTNPPWGKKFGKLEDGGPIVASLVQQFPRATLCLLVNKPTRRSLEALLESRPPEEGGLQLLRVVKVGCVEAVLVGRAPAGGGAAAAGPARAEMSAAEVWLRQHEAAEQEAAKAGAKAARRSEWAKNEPAGPPAAGGHRPRQPARDPTAAPTAAPTPTALKPEDAFAYLELVKARHENSPATYRKFLGIMKDFKSGALDAPAVIEHVLQLFHGERDLIVGFNAFLSPTGYRITYEGVTPQIQRPGGEGSEEQRGATAALRAAAGSHPGRFDY